MKQKDWKALYAIPAFMPPASSLRRRILQILSLLLLPKDSDLLVTQIEGSIIEEAGVIKMDFLGLKTLTILKNALELIKAKSWC